MHKQLISSAQILAVLLVVALVIPSGVFALTIQLNDRGGATFYQDQVLGEDDVNEKETESEIESEAETETKTDDRSDSEDEMEIKPTPKPELTEIKRNEKRKIEVKASKAKKEKLEIQLKNKLKQGKQEKVETLESTTVKFKRPKSKLGLEMEQEFEIHRDDSGEEIKFKANGVEVKTRAQFNVDPETNLVTLTAPSGQERELKHFPNEALEAMSERLGEVQSGTESTDTTKLKAEIELKENSQGKMVYQATVQEPKKFLGIIGWTKPKTIELDDETGVMEDVSVSSQTLNQNNWFEWVKNRLSF